MQGFGDTIGKLERLHPARGHIHAEIDDVGRLLRVYRRGKHVLPHHRDAQIDLGRHVLLEYQRCEPHVVEQRSLVRFQEPRFNSSRSSERPDADRPRLNSVFRFSTRDAGDGLIRVQQDLPVGLSPHQPDRQAGAQLAAGGLVADPTFEPGP